VDAAKFRRAGSSAGSSSPFGERGGIAELEGNHDINGGLCALWPSVHREVRVRVERLFVAFGFSGTEFKTAPAVGASMAELILTGTSTTIDQTPFGFERILSGRMIEGPNEYELGAGFGH